MWDVRSLLVEHALLDHLIRPQQNRLRDREAERLRGLEVEDKLEFRGLLDWQIGGPSSAEDLDQVRYCSAMLVEPYTIDETRHGRRASRDFLSN